MKKFLLPILIAVIVMQLLTPAYMIIHKYDILANGEEYKFRVRPVDPYDAFRGRYVQLGASDISWDLTGKYGVIHVDEDGFAVVSGATDIKPDGNAYIKNNSKDYFQLPIDRYYMDEKFAPEAERLVQRGEREAYVTVRVKNGNLVISGLYLDGVAIEEVIRSSI
jgi:uncharacterized membrane-anchored protein